jgi:hypothetical protein
LSSAAGLSSGRPHRSLGCLLAVLAPLVVLSVIGYIGLRTYFSVPKFDLDKIMPLPDGYEVVAEGYESEFTQRDEIRITHLAVTAPVDTDVVEVLGAHFEDRGFPSATRELPRHELWAGGSEEAGGSVAILEPETYEDSGAGLREFRDDLVEIMEADGYGTEFEVYVLWLRPWGR